MKSLSVLLVCLAALAPASLAVEIAAFDNPLENWSQTQSGMFYLSATGLSGGWTGQPLLTLRSAQTAFDNVVMTVAPMHVNPDGSIPVGQITFTQNGRKVFAINFLNGHVDKSGFGADPLGGGAVMYSFPPGGVKPPYGLTYPVTGAAFRFTFEEARVNGKGLEYIASFKCTVPGGDPTALPSIPVEQGGWEPAGIGQPTSPEGGTGE